MHFQKKKKIGGFAIMVLFGDVTSGQHSWVRGHDKHSSSKQWVVASLAMQAIYCSTLKLFSPLLQGERSLCLFFVSTGKFQLIPQRLSWLKIKLVLPKLSPTRGTALHSWEVNDKGLWPTKARKCPQQDSFTFFSMGKWKTPWQGTWKGKLGFISEFLNWDSTLKNRVKSFLFQNSMTVYKR